MSAGNTYGCDQCRWEGKACAKHAPTVVERGYRLKQTPKVPHSEFCLPFVQGMLDRMGMSFFKYGAVAEAYPHKVNAILSLLLRLRAYLGVELFTELCAQAAEAPETRHRRELGNTEYLMDAANFAMIEFMRPRLVNAHFTPTDSEDSTGRATNAGNVNQEANTIGRENVRRGGSNRTTAGGFYKREGD